MKEGDKYSSSHPLLLDPDVSIPVVVIPGVHLLLLLFATIILFSVLLPGNCLPLLLLPPRVKMRHHS